MRRIESDGVQSVASPSVRLFPVRLPSLIDVSAYKISPFLSAAVNLQSAYFDGGGKFQGKGRAERRGLAHHFPCEYPLVNTH